MKQRNRILSLMLAILLVVGMVPISAIAADTGETYTLTIKYAVEDSNGIKIGTEIADKVITGVAPGTVIDLSDYWPDKMSVTGSNGETYYFLNHSKYSNNINSPLYRWVADKNDVIYVHYAGIGLIRHAPYELTFDPNGGAVNCQKILYLSFPFTDLSSEDQLVPVRNGYRFLGWSLDKNELSNQYDVVEQSGTLYAIWEELPSVQVGMTILYDGEYTTDGQSTTTTKPESGGYAHFENGVLTLHDFTYSGGGYYLSAIYCNHALTIKVEGENNITRDVTSDDTDTKMALRGIRVENGKLTIIGDSKDDSLRVVVDGHDDVSASGIYGDTGGIDIYNCTLEARSVNGGKGLNAPGNITITGAKVIGASETPAISLNNQGIYAGILKVTNSNVIGIADNTSPGRATGIYLDASKSKLIYESGTIVGEVPDALSNSYSIYIDTNDVTLPAKYWMRTSASADFVEGTWDGANVGPYIELTTAKQSGSIANISEMDKVYDGSAVEAPTVNTLSTGAKTFKYKMKGTDDSTYTTEAPINVGEYTCLITVATDDNYTEATATKDFVISKATPTAPTTPVGVNTTYIDTTDGKITGVDSTMEYRKDGETNYTAVTGTEITNLAAGTYYVRYAETENYNPSPNKVITTSLGGKRTPTIDTDPTASRVIIGGKLSDSTLTGGVASVPGEFAWVDPDAVMNTAGKFDMLVRFTPSSTVTYNTVDFEIEVEVVVCDTANGEHDFTEQKTNADEHWNVCAKCGVEEADSRETHKGGTATCTAKAKCEVCDTEYGDEPSHGETEIRNAKPTSCDEEGYTGDKYCKVCGEKLESGAAIAKTAHTYENGKCTVCGAADPNYKPTSPQTGDNSNMALWLALLFISGMGIVATTALSRKKLNKR